MLLKQNFIFIQDVIIKFPYFKRLTLFYKYTLLHDPSIIFKTNDFTSIEQEKLLELLETYKPHLKLKQIELWEKIEKWTNVQYFITKIPFKTLIQPFISFIDFKEIDRKDFHQKVRPYKYVFDDKFYVEIIEHYAFSDINNRINTNLLSELKNLRF
jgi:hypothetical protein